jgi:hypothetical protein
MRFPWLLALTLLTTAAAHADSLIIMFTALPTTIEEGTYNGFSAATINGIPNQYLICDDYTHDTYVPSSNLVYDYSTLNGSQPLQFARFTGANELRNYEEAAVLVVALANYLGSGNANANGITDYQYALWNLFAPYNAQTNPGGAQADANQQALQAWALGVVNAGGPVATSAYRQLAIYTPSAAFSSNQEFLGLNTPSPAPEPGTLLPLAAALLAGCWVALRRKRAGTSPGVAD